MSAPKKNTLFSLVDISTQVDINRPVAEVSGFVSNPDNAPLWYGNIRSIQWQREIPMSIGSRISFTAYFLRSKLSYIYEIIDFVPGKKLMMRTAKGPFPMETTYTWEAIGPESTRMTLRNQGRPSGFALFFAPFISKAIRRANQKDLKNLKALLEKK